MVTQKQETIPAKSFIPFQQKARTEKGTAGQLAAKQVFFHRVTVSALKLVSIKSINDM